MLKILEPKESAEVVLIPLFPFITAGFPSAGEDFVEKEIDLNEYLIKNKPATFYVRVRGNSLEGIGIYDGDLMIVDKSLEFINGDLAVVYLDGEFTAKMVKVERDQAWLVSANANYKPIMVTSENEFSIFGIVAHNVHSFRNKW
jgi:DNA polymerase V